jgi:acyl-ACP dehydrogenase
MTPASPPAEIRRPGAVAGESFVERVERTIRKIVPLVEHAERERRFPRAAVSELGAAGILRERWSAPTARPAAVLAEQLGRAGTGGVGLGVTVHAEAALSMLLRHGRTSLLQRIADEALDGANLVAVAASEAGGGSDLTQVETVMRRDGDGLVVRGEKRFVSLGGSADFLVVSCRAADDAKHASHPRLSLIVVPRADVRVEKRLRTVGVQAAETSRVTIDARVPHDAMLGRPGAGLLALSYGLTHERLATAALSIGTAELAVGLATAHLGRRVVGDQPLLTRQAPRLLLAEHAAHVGLLRRALHSIAASPLRSSRATRDVAGLKATAARVAERVLSDCMHLFGGAGYLEDETPLARLWRDVRAARIGGGSDEMMWELVAGGLVPADDAYRAMVDVR